MRVDTDLTITGKVAQFGRGVLADVSTKLMEQFVHNLETDVFGSGGGAAEVPAPPAPESSTVANNGPRRIQSAPAEPVDLLATAGNPVVKRIGPIIGVLVVVLWLLRRRKKKRQ